MVQEKPLPLEKEELSYAPKLLEASENGMIKVKLEEDVVVQRISHDLYSNPNSGFREFYANELRACRLAAKKYGAKPKIVITLNPSSRMLTIQGIDSLGISQERFLQVYAVLGRSDNFDSHEVGQWGFGRGAYTTLSDTMILETYSREDGTKYAVLGKNGVGYNLLPEPHIDSFGTKVTFILRNDIDIRKLEEYIEECAALSGVETHLILTEDIPDTWNTERNKKKGEYVLNKTVEQFIEEEKNAKFNRYGAVTSAMSKDERFLDINVEDEDFSLNGFLGINIDDRYVSIRNTCYVYLLGIPIESDINLPLSFYILNIKDERKYSPTTDRERLTEKAERALTEKIIPLLRQELSYLNVRTVDEYLALPDKQRIIVEFCLQGLEGLFTEETTDLSRFLNIRLRVIDVENGKRVSSYSLMHDVVRRAGGVNKIFYRQEYTVTRINAVKSVIPDAIFIKLDRRENIVTATELLRKFGVQFVDEFIESNNIKVKGVTTEKSEIVVHGSHKVYYSWGRFPKTRSCIEYLPFNEVDSNVITIPKGKMHKYISLVGSLSTNYKITQERKGLKKAKPLEEFVKECEAKKILTNEGEMTVLELVSQKKEIKLHLYSDPKLAEYYWSDKSCIHVFGGDDLLFEIASVLIFHGIDPTIDTDGRVEFDEFSTSNTLSYTQFLDDPGYEKLGDSEILFSVIHVVKAVKDARIKELFLNAARYLTNEEGVRRMREYALELDAIRGKK
jgi:hypothetical protein